MDRAELKRIVKEKGIEWLVAALVEGSLGYHSPQHARKIIERALAGETKDYCERCMGSYGCDLFAMIEPDIRNMERIEKRSPAQFERIVGSVKRMSGMGPEAQHIAGLMYPTTG